MKRKVISIAVLLIVVSNFVFAQNFNKPRTIVTCDPELDDQNSMIRFLLHATDFQIDGLVYTSSRFHWKGDDK
jgi:hypothetical protein